MLISLEFSRERHYKWDFRDYQVSIKGDIGSQVPENGLVSRFLAVFRVEQPLETKMLNY